MQITPMWMELMELADELDGALAGKLVDLTTVRDIGDRMRVATERNGIAMKQIADLANYGRQTDALRRWLAALTRKETAGDSGELPPAA